MTLKCKSYEYSTKTLSLSLNVALQFTNKYNVFLYHITQAALAPINETLNLHQMGFKIPACGTDANPIAIGFVIKSILLYCFRKMLIDFRHTVQKPNSEVFHFLLFFQISLFGKFLSELWNTISRRKFQHSYQVFID